MFFSYTVIHNGIDPGPRKQVPWPVEASSTSTATGALRRGQGLRGGGGGAGTGIGEPGVKGGSVIYEPFDVAWQKRKIDLLVLPEKAGKVKEVLVGVRGGGEGNH